MCDGFQRHILLPSAHSYYMPLTFSENLMTLFGIKKKKRKNKKGQQLAASSPTERQHNKSQVAFGQWLWCHVICKNLTARGPHSSPSNQMRSRYVLQVLYCLVVYLRADRKFCYLQLLQATTDGKVTSNFLLQVVFQYLSKIKRLVYQVPWQKCTPFEFIYWNSATFCLSGLPAIIPKPTGFSESSFSRKRKWKEAKILLSTLPLR